MKNSRIDNVRKWKKEGKFVRNGKCPICGSRRGLGIYSDHEYCFVCDYHKSYVEGNKTVLLLGNNMNPNKETEPMVTLPDDACNVFDNEGLEWLRKYEISDEEIVDNHICWSEIRKSIIFPFYNSSKELIMWQARSFRTSPDPKIKIPKYYTRGYKKSDYLPIFYYEDSSMDDAIVLVEDILSAIKVRRVQDAMPLLGSYIDKELLTRLSKFYTSVVLWLDKDKQDTYKKYISFAKILFDKVSLVYTDLDPKEYSATIIKEFLTNSQNPEKSSEGRCLH